MELIGILIFGVAIWWWHYDQNKDRMHRNHVRNLEQDHRDQIERLKWR